MHSHSNDFKGIIGGACLVVLGCASAIYAVTSLSLGTLRNMGPGMFPASLGVLLTLFGLLVFLPALFRVGEAPVIEYRPLLTAVISMLAFALIVTPFGMVPAVVVMVVVASRADRKIGFFPLLVLSAALGFAAWFIFEFCLGLQLVSFSWPV